MKKIVYYIASSIDGFIAGADDDVSRFVADGDGVKKYLADLQGFQTVIMGRNTYEFGYKYGLVPGKPAYPHMEHFIFSNNLSFDDPDPKVHVRKIDLAEVIRIKESSNTDIYLCGGGIFAGWLLEHEMIDVLKVKLNPFVQGKGIKMFGASTKEYSMSLVGSKAYENGLLINSYDIIYT